MIGAYWFLRDLKNSKRKKISLSDDLHDKQGIPVIPRHLRKFSEKSNNETTGADDKQVQGASAFFADPTIGAIPTSDSDVGDVDDATSGSVRFKNLKSIAEQGKAEAHNKIETDNQFATLNTDTKLNSDGNNTNDEPLITEKCADTADTEVLISNEHSNIHSDIHNYPHSSSTNLTGTTNDTLPTNANHAMFDIPPVTIKAEAPTIDAEDEPYSDFDDEIKQSLQKDMDLINNTVIEFSSELDGTIDTELTVNLDKLNDDINEDTDGNASTRHVYDDDVDSAPITRRLHYTLGTNDDSDASHHEVSDEEIASPVNQVVESADAIIQQDNTKQDVPTEAGLFATTTQTNKVQEKEVSEEVNVTNSATTLIAPTDSKKAIDAKSTLTEVSPVLDRHLQAAAEQDQNSPLINASDNLNISIVPFNEFSHISGKKLLQMVDDFGFKFGAMNMFHRYQNKDGSGILWFSMMGLTRDGIVPFDLNTLPTIDDLKGLVMFLPLPHPKVMQGFDSMMSIAGLMAREIDGYIVDEYGDEVTVEYKKELRNLLQSTLVDDD